MICVRRKTRIPRRQNQDGGHQKTTAHIKSQTILRKSVRISRQYREILALTIAERLALLCHILMNTRDLHECSTDDLKQAITSDRGKIKPIEKEAILQDVWKIGELIERFKDGQVGETDLEFCFE